MANQTQYTSDALPTENASVTATPAYRAELRTQPALVKAGEPVTLEFTVKDGKGNVVRDLQVVHEWPIHLLVISDDLSEFYHLHPEQETDGSFRITHTFPQAGN